MPADIALMPVAQQMLIDLKDGDAAGRTLVERVGEFFPEATDFEWLTNPGSKTFLEVFFNEESSTGWFTGDEYNEFWGYAADYSDYLDNQDGSEAAFEGHAGLTTFLTPVVGKWETASQQSAPVIDPATIGPVEGYLGWWQGYDGQEEIWKYIQSAEIPSDRAEGWVISTQVDWDDLRARNIYGTALTRQSDLDQAVAWAAIRAAVSSTEADDETIIRDVLASQQPAIVIDPATIGPVEGYPGWWQGYDSLKQVWKYAQSEEKPADKPDGWVVDAEVDWDNQRAQSIYRTALARHPDLNQATAWSAIWEAVNNTQADDETIIRDVVLASQELQVKDSSTPAPLPPQLAQEIRAVIIPLADEFMKTLPPELAAHKEARKLVEQRFKQEAAQILAGRGAGEKG